MTTLPQRIDADAVAVHRGSPLLVLGPAGSGRSEALVRRFAGLVAEGSSPGGILVVCSTEAGRARLRSGIERALPRPGEELWVETWTGLCERLLRDYALEAGRDPFFEVAGPADRLAALLERLDELPLRRHEIRGDPSGLLTRLLERIDMLKAEGIGTEEIRERARAAERGAPTRAEREEALREIEFAGVYERHDSLMAERGTLDERELVLELGRLLSRREDVAETIGKRFPHLLVDELEDASRAQVALLGELAAGDVVATADPDQGLTAFRAFGEGGPAAFLRLFDDAETSVLARPANAAPVAATALEALAGLVPDRYRIDLGEEEPAPPGTAELDLAFPQASGPAPVPAEPVVRFWRCRNERAEAQTVAREVEHLLASGELRPEQVCVIAGPAGREGRLVAAALEERNIPWRSVGNAAFFHRPEIRDAIAWLRALADPFDAAAVVRTLTRPPVELPSVDLARCTTIARRRKLDMISAVGAALESPQLPPESRDRLRAFLKLYRSAARALDALRADVFVHRLIERVGFRRERLFGASPETAERLVNLSRLAETAAAWARRRPDGTTREFVRYLSAVAEAGRRFDTAAAAPPAGAVILAEPAQIKGMSFERVYLIGLDAGALRGGAETASWVPDDLLRGEAPPPPGPGIADALSARRAYVASARARSELVFSRTGGEDERPASQVYEAVLAALGGSEEEHDEELFGPAEGLHSTYRMLRDDVLESSWRAGAALSEMRLDTAADVNSAIARFLELLKLSALIQRPGGESEEEALDALNDLIGRVATPEQLAELERSSLDSYVIGEGRDRSRRRKQLASRGEPGLEAFLPRRNGGLALSASDINLYRTCPLKYKFARVFAIPQEPTINQRFGILIHNVLDRFHADELRGGATRGDGGGLDRLLGLFEAGWRRSGFGHSDDELQYRDRAVAALARYYERDSASASRPVWLERQLSFKIAEHTIRGRVDRVDRHPDGSYELVDYKTGAPAGAEDLRNDIQIPLYRIGAREAWEIDVADGSYWYILDDEKVTVGGEPDDLERVERTVLDVAGGIGEQDFEPKPSFKVCSWCDYRLICPAAEA